MTHRETLSDQAIAISISESSDLSVLGLSNDHLRDAMAEIARHLLALGACLIYGGDLRDNGFSDLLFELVARHRRDAPGDKVGVVSYLAWPVHIAMSAEELQRYRDELTGSAELVCLSMEGAPLSAEQRQLLPARKPTKREWAVGLTAMRSAMCQATDARIVLGGRVKRYKGIMPGAAEETLITLQARKPLFLLGGFGGCARDIADILGLRSRPAPDDSWQGRDEFRRFEADDLCNGLTLEENDALAYTAHVDQAIALILRGLLGGNVSSKGARG